MLLSVGRYSGYLHNTVLPVLLSSPAGSWESFVGASLVLSGVVGGKPLHFIAVLMVTFLEQLLKINILKWVFDFVRTAITFCIN